MNIKHLEHLLALAQTGSFSRAADALFITQSALSRSIQSLEEELEGRLIDRIGKRNELTPLGQDVVRRAARIVNEAEELRRSAELLRLGGEGELRVGLGSGPGALLMTPLMCHMARHHPHVRLAITRGPTELQLVELRARQLDALVVDARRVSPAPDLQIETVAELRAGFVCRADHPLAALPTVRFDDIAPCAVASTPLSDEVARLLVTQYGPGADPQTLVSLSCDEVASLIETVERSDAVFLGVIAAARAGIDAGRLVELPIKPRMRASAHYALVKLAGRTEGPVMEVFRRFIGETLHD